MDQSISLNKFISDTGYCSRREADELITAGRVLINNKPARLGNRYKHGDQVEVDGSLITMDNREKLVYIAFNKPLGITTTTEEHVKGNIISYINFPKRIFPIGRLDKDSEGLIFLTNDGDIVNKLLRAGNAHEKEYIVRVNKPITPGFAEKMAAGIPMLGTVTLPCKVVVTGRQSFRIVLTQGLNRQIRRMCEFLGYNVEGLQRVRIMNVRIDKLAPGKWRYLSDAEITLLKESVKDSSGQAVKNPKFREPATKSTSSKKKASFNRSGAKEGRPDKTKRTSSGKNAGTSRKSSPERNSLAEKKADFQKKAKAAKKLSSPAKTGSSAKPSATKKTSSKTPITEKKPMGKYKAFRQKGK